jgi:hypothetical protein
MPDSQQPIYQTLNPDQKERLRLLAMNVVREKAVWLGDVEAESQAEAIAKGAEGFKQDPNRLMAVRRG